MLQLQVLFFILIFWSCKCDELFKQEKVVCAVYKENRTRYEWEFDGTFKTDEDGFETKIMTPMKQIVNAQVIKCNLYENSGLTYNQIGKNLTELYDLYGNRSDYGKLINMNLLYSSIVNYIYDDSHPPFFEVSFENAEWQLLPNEFDIVFRQLNSLNVTNCGLAILDKQNLKQFGKYLKAANFSGNLLTFIMGDLFEFNVNLKYCDFSDNPISHIADHYFDQQVLVAKNLSYDFNNVDCMSQQLTNFNNYAFAQHFKPINCTNTASVINYVDLEYHLTKEPEEKGLSCSANIRCIHSATYNKGKPTINYHITEYYTCDMKVLNPRTIVAKKVNLTQSGDMACDGKPFRNSLTFFQINQLEFIPQGMLSALEREFSTFNILQCKLASVNEFNMRQFGESLMFVDFSANNLEVIGKNVFKHNGNLETVNLAGNPIVFVDPMFLMENTYRHIEFNESRYRCGKTV